MDAVRTEYDHIVVGAGAAGCVLARRLVDAGRRVLLVEAGGQDDKPEIHDPAGVWELWNSDVDWAYSTVAQEYAGGTSLFWPRGKVVGGSSSLNGMIYVRGHRADYDGWAYNGAWGWSYEDVLPYFKRSEDHEDGESVHHGKGGPLPVTHNHQPNPVSSAFVDACIEYGLDYNPDCNGEEMLGVGYTQHNIVDGKRVSSWRAFVAPILDNPLLTVLTNTTVNRLLFSGPHCTGVELAVDSRAIAVRSAHDVVVCAGTIGSAQLLLLNGIGPADDLRALDIDVQADLPGVGENLHDHLLAPVVWESAQPIEPARSNQLEVQFFAKSHPGMLAPDMQPLMSHTPLPVVDSPTPERGFSALAGMIRPHSRGKLWLRSTDPAQPPALDPRCLAEPQDYAALETALRLCREIGQARALDDWRVRETAPGPDVREPTEIRDYIHRNLLSYHHQVGTCRMGVDHQAVVDPHLQVRGIDNLRVADASVMPTIPSGNTHAATIMIAERAVDLIIQEQSRVH